MDTCLIIEGVTFDEQKFFEVGGGKTVQFCGCGQMRGMVSGGGHGREPECEITLG